MKKLMTVLSVLAFLGCNRQEQKKEIQQDKSYEIAQDHTAVKPKGQWKVHREYDEYGNLIKYDSVYSYSYSNIKGDSLDVNLDSIMDTFKGYFGENTRFKWKDDFFYFPKTDSLFMYDFFNNDYFFRNWQSEHAELEKMIKKMDSTRNAFLKKFYPGLLESKKNKI